MQIQFRNRQPKTVSLPIQKSTAKNSVAADSEIDSQNFSAADSEFGSQKVCRCRLRNRQQKWSHFSFTSFFFVFLGVYILPS
jgi:hypothetical protein